jgi:cellobiose-specific phosphotransferase system component IIA
MAGAEQAWTTMIAASGRAASDCLAALQHGSRRSAKDFQKQLKVVNQDEVTLNRDLNGSSASPGNP